MPDTKYAPCECGTWPTPSDVREGICRVCRDYRPAAWYERARRVTFGEPAFDEDRDAGVHGADSAATAGPYHPGREPRKPAFDEDRER